MTFTHALHHTLFALGPCPRAQPSTEPCFSLSEPWKAQLRVSLPLRVRAKISHTTCGILQRICYFTSRLTAFSYPSSMKLTWLTVLTIFHDASSGTVALGVYLLWCGTIAPCDIEILNLWCLEQSPSLQQQRMSTLTAHSHRS